MYFVANDYGEVAKSDIMSETEANIICDELKEQYPDDGWEVLNDDYED